MSDKQWDYFTGRCKKLGKHVFTESRKGSLMGNFLNVNKTKNTK